MENVVETSFLTKSFGRKCAVNQISMHIRRGDIYGFIGRNGAGKTTMMKLVLGLARPTSGQMALFGSMDLDAGRRKIGSLIEAPGLYKNCSAYENMKRFSILYGGDDQQIWNILYQVGLANTGKMPVAHFSLGMKQRLGIGIALLGNPELLVLDEPINGLDPAAIKEVRDILLRLNQERQLTIFISSHLLDELGKITTRYGIVNNGILVEEVDAAALKERCKGKLQIRTNDNLTAVNLLMQQAQIPGNFLAYNEEKIWVYAQDKRPEDINELLVRNGMKVRELTFSEDGFEQYFIERIGR